MKNQELNPALFHSSSIGKNIALLVFAIVLSLGFSSITLGAGELDTGFSAAAYGTQHGQVNVIKNQADGKILVGGYFSMVSGMAAKGEGREKSVSRILSLNIPQ